MDILASESALTDLQVDTLLLFLTQQGGAFAASVDSVNGALNDHIAELVREGDFVAKAGQLAVMYPRGALGSSVKRVILAGIGEESDYNAEALRRAAANGIKRARDLKSQQVALALPSQGSLGPREAAQAMVEGMRLGLYTYRGQKTGDAPSNSLQSLTLVASDPVQREQAQAGIAAGEAFAAGTLLARELANLPANICTPEYMARTATDMAAEVGLRAEVLGRQQMQALRMGALLAVAQGSETPPCFIILEHNADRRDALPTVVLVGKGVTFDTGGYSLKPKEGMIGMKGDMSGGAAVIGAMRTIALLDVPLHVVGLVPAADNMVSGKAYRPQDVITASNGTTIEIISTDAEGRLLLADALVYAKRYQPAAVVDIATLTGAVVVALGNAAAGLFSIDDALRDTLIAAGEATGERVWSMPIFPEYRKAIESQTADTKNSSGARQAGAGVAAAFLRQFVDDSAWAHVDMAGMMGNLPDHPYVPQGASGYGSRLLAEFARRFAASTQD